MSRFFSGTIFLFAAILAVFTSGFGQTAQPRPTPFAVGEELVYDAKASKIISGIPIAELKFVLQKAPDSENFLIKTEAASRGTLLKIFRYSFLQQYESIIDPANFSIIKTTKHDVQKERVRDSVAEFDYPQKSVVFTETNPKEPNRAPRRIASDLPGPVYDIVSGIYSLRLRTFSVGKSFDMALSDSGLVFEIPIRVAAREQIKTPIGKLWCYRLEPAVFGPDRFIEQKGSLTIWVTDDDRRLPVRARVITDAFRVDVNIRSVSNAK